MRLVLAFLNAAPVMTVFWLTTALPPPWPWSRPAAARERARARRFLRMLRMMSSDQERDA